MLEEEGGGMWKECKKKRCRPRELSKSIFWSKAVDRKGRKRESF